MSAFGRDRARYRIGQGLRYLRPAPPDAIERDAALAVLPPAAAAAFRALPPPDQSHALRVYAALVADGETDAHLLAAALLHDVGKGSSVGVTHRAAKVLLARWPRALAYVAGTEVAGMGDVSMFPRWRANFARLRDHAALGAALAASWGCTPETVALIRASHDADAPPAARRLQAADDRA